MVYLANSTCCQGRRTAIPCALLLRGAARIGSKMPASRLAFWHAIGSFLPGMPAARFTIFISAPIGAFPPQISQAKKLKRGLYVYQA